MREPSVVEVYCEGSATRTPGVSAASCVKLRPIERQVDHAFGAHHFAQGRVFRLQQRRRAHHLHGLLHLAQLQAEIDTRLLPDLNHDACAAFTAEARRAHLHGVFARNQVAHLVGAIGAGDYAVRDTRGGGSDRDGGVGHHGATRIGLRFPEWRYRASAPWQRPRETTERYSSETYGNPSSWGGIIS